MVPREVGDVALRAIAPVRSERFSDPQASSQALEEACRSGELAQG